MSFPAPSFGQELAGAHWVWELRTRSIRWVDPSVGPLRAQEAVSTAALLALIHPDDRNRLGHEARRARRARTPFAVACRIMLPGGPPRWYCLHGQWQVKPHSPPRLVGLALVMPEPTALSPQLLELTWMTEALRASEAREQARAAELQTVLDAVPAIVWIAHDPDCRVITGNLAAQALLRMGPGSNLSKSAPDEERPAHFRVLRGGVELAPEELPVQLAARGFTVQDFEEDVVFDDGTTRTLLGNATPLWDEQGRPRGAVAAFLDITERRESERERLSLLTEAPAAHAEAEAALRLRDNLLAVVTHDLKNPLTVILGQAQLLQRRLRRPEFDLGQVSSSITAVEQAARQVLGQIDELLDLVRLQSGAPLELQREPADLNALLRRITEAFQQMTERHQIELLVPPSLPSVTIDPARFERALSNLLGNALKYSPAGGRVTVRLEAVAAGGDRPPVLVLSVQDEGVGIPAADLPQIFQRYYRASNVRAMPGTGLGLTSARQIIEQHGGVLAVDSSEGVGTTVRIELPLV